MYVIFGTLDASLLGNTLAVKGVVRAGYRSKEEGIVRAGYEFNGSSLIKD